jgi:hypothetical protein
MEAKLRAIAVLWAGGRLRMEADTCLRSMRYDKYQTRSVDVMWTVPDYEYGGRLGSDAPCSLRDSRSKS